MKTAATFIAVVAILVAMFVALFGLSWVGVEWNGFLGERKAEIDRNIYEESKSYNHGKAQDLSRFRLQYLRAESEDEKAAIASTIRIQFAEYDPNKLQSEELREFLDEIMNPTP